MENLIGDHLPSEAEVGKLVKQLEDVAHKLEAFTIKLTPDQRRALLKFRPGGDEVVSNVVATLAKKHDVDKLARNVIFSWSSLSSPNDFTTEIVPYSSLGFGASGGTFQRRIVGDTRFFIEVQSPDSIAVFDPATRAIVDPALTSRRPSEYPLAVRGGAVALDLETPYGIFFVGDDGTYARIAHTDPPNLPNWLAVDRSNDDALVWIEAPDGTGGSTGSTLWTAPFTTDEASLVRHKVGPVVSDFGGAATVANAGVAVFTQTSAVATLMRLADGATWQVAAEPGVGFVAPLWVDDNEVWFATYALGRDPVAIQGMVRIRRDTLGAPTPAP